MQLLSKPWLLIYSSLLITVTLLIIKPPLQVLATTKSHLALCPLNAFTSHCHAHIVTNSVGIPLATSVYGDGLTPADLHSAYKLPLSNNAGFIWNGQTVAIVDAYNNPFAADDLLAYRQQFGLPDCKTGGVNCILSKVNQNGTTALPRASSSWGTEINLDVQMVSAICPNCKILVVEATSPSLANLATAVDTAVRLGATVVSNSYGGPEDVSIVSANNHYNHPGTAITASSGDSGYGVEFPASSGYVTAVGGTTLNQSNSPRGWTETAWSGSGSGCSKYIARPSWQASIGTCTKRMVADISAVADPKTGVAVYDSFGSSGGKNWYVVGGTSVAAPIVAGIYALAMASNHKNFSYSELPYNQSSSLFDVTNGSNGSCSTRIRPLCKAGIGYDGPTGLGSPNGIAAF